MRNEKFKTFWFFGLMLIVSLAYMYFNYRLAYAHEMAHKMIFSYYGIDSKITVNFLGEAYTQGNVTQLKKLYEYNPDLYSSLMNAQSTVDAFGYHIDILYDVFFFMMSMFVLLLYLILTAIDDLYDAVRYVNLNRNYTEITDAIGGSYGVKELC